MQTQRHIKYKPRKFNYPKIKSERKPITIRLPQQSTTQLKIAKKIVGEHQSQSNRRFGHRGDFAPAIGNGPANVGGAREPPGGAGPPEDRSLITSYLDNLKLIERRRKRLENCVHVRNYPSRRVEIPAKISPCKILAGVVMNLFRR